MNQLEVAWLNYKQVDPTASKKDFFAGANFALFAVRAEYLPHEVCENTARRHFYEEIRKQRQEGEKFGPIGNNEMETCECGECKGKGCDYCLGFGRIPQRKGESNNA